MRLLDLAGPKATGIRYSTSQLAEHLRCELEQFLIASQATRGLAHAVAYAASSGEFA